MFIDETEALPIGEPEKSIQLAQWKAFIKQNVSSLWDMLTLPNVVAVIAAFLLPVLEAAAKDDFNDAAHWLPGGPWK